MSKWCVKKCSVPSEELTAFYGVNKPLAYALYNRKIRDRDSINKYFNKESYPFENITDLKGVKEAFYIIKEAIEHNSKIYIYGDYDADGVTSTSIIYKGLKGLGADVYYFIPNRVEDGYGLNERAVEMIIKNGAELIITCDNGITALSQIEFAKNMGAKVVVLDHHEPAFEEKEGVKYDILPKADAVVDTKIKDCGYKFTQMCAGGLCYRFICGFYEFLGKEIRNKEELCELAAVATICDVVDLTEENRAIAAMGLDIMNKGSNNIGLKSLIKLKEIKNVSSYSVGFIIGPCINASGRLDSAKIAVELFITEDEKKAEKLAENLIDYNEERKDITQKCLERIIENIENSDIINDKVIVAYDEETHESVAGIIAGRLRERYNRPAIVLTKAESDVKGSGRSVEVYDMFKALFEVKELMLKFGGHTMAAGLSIEEKNINIFRKRINENCTLTLDDMELPLRVEAILDLNDISIESADELNILSPYGKANEKPMYGIRNAVVENIRFVGTDSNIVSAFITDGIKRVKVIDFDNYSLWIDCLEKNNYTKENCGRAKFNIDAVFNLDVNEYNGYRNPQMVLKDIRLG